MPLPLLSSTAPSDKAPDSRYTVRMMKTESCVYYSAFDFLRIIVKIVGSSSSILINARCLRRVRILPKLRS